MTYVGNEQLIVIVDGPDGVGKTQIARELSRRLDIPYFKPTTERSNWRAGADAFKNELVYGEIRQVQLLKQTGLSLVQDRGYPSEFVYSQVYDRPTSYTTLSSVDEAYSFMGTTLVIPLLRDYSLARDDELVRRERLPELHERYLAFVQTSLCRTVVMYVDELGRDIDREMDYVAGCTGWPITNGGKR